MRSFIRETGLEKQSAKAGIYRDVLVTPRVISSCAAMKINICRPQRAHANITLTWNTTNKQNSNSNSNNSNKKL